MVESKQVKVDNWGIFFLQRLQQFYNKSSFCDLILHFDDNVQTKVHRLVMNACTEYFQILEQTCLVEKNCLMMPSNLPSDVVIPIINFMYSGILEFNESSFDRLYSTAKLMNMSVLTKLLDAQKTPIKPMPKRVQSVTPITWNLQGKRISAKTYVEPDFPDTLPGRKLPIWKRKTMPSIPFLTSNNFENFSQKVVPKTAPEEPPKPTRFEWPEEDSTFDNTFDDISYESKPLIMPTSSGEKSPKPSTSSTFEEIKKSAVPVKRSASPLGNQCKKVNIQDVKEYLKEQKIRSDYIDYDDAEMADNDLQTFDNEDSNEETGDVCMQNIDESPNKSILKNDTGTTHSTKHVRFSLDGKENKEKKVQPVVTKTLAKISATPPKPEQSAPDMSKHTKIITEVLKKYPHLVKNNKNIRLKILQKGPTTPNTPPTMSKTNIPVKQSSKISYKVVKPENVPKSQLQAEQTWECTNCEEPQTFSSYLTYRQHLTEVHNEKQDSQMCNVCGHVSRKQNMLVYHKFVKHNIPPPAMFNFPKCKECNYVALSPIMLQKHLDTHSHTNTCHECNKTFPNKTTLVSHLQQTGHAQVSVTPQWGCTYCEKRFFSENILKTHMKRSHEEEMKTDEAKKERRETHEPTPIKKDKIKILSDVKVSPSIVNQTYQVKTCEETPRKEETEVQSSEAEALSNVASGIAASLGLVDTIVVLDDNQFILQSQQNILNSTEEYILPQMNLPASSMEQTVTLSDSNVLTQSYKSGMTSTDELVMVLTDHDYSDGTNNTVISDNNIVVLYSHPVQTQSGTMMLSDTRMIEVDKNFTQSLPVSLNEQQTSCEESIEMIQQEINNQLDNNVQTETLDCVYEDVEMKEIDETPQTDITDIENTEIIIIKSPVNENIAEVKEIAVSAQKNHQMEMQMDHIHGTNEMVDSGHAQIEEMYEDVQHEEINQTEKEVTDASTIEENIKDTLPQEKNEVAEVQDAKMEEIFEETQLKMQQIHEEPQISEVQNTHQPEIEDNKETETSNSSNIQTENLMQTSEEVTLGDTPVNEISNGTAQIEENFTPKEENTTQIEANLIPQEENTTQTEENTPEMPQIEDNTSGMPQIEENISEMPLIEENTPEMPQLEDNTLQIPQIEENLSEMPKIEENIPEMPQIEENIPGILRIEENITEIKEDSQQIEENSMCQDYIVEASDLKEESSFESHPEEERIDQQSEIIVEKANIETTLENYDEMEVDQVKSDEPKEISEDSVNNSYVVEAGTEIQENKVENQEEIVNNSMIIDISAAEDSICLDSTERKSDDSQVVNKADDISFTPNKTNTESVDIENREIQEVISQQSDSLPEKINDAEKLSRSKPENENNGSQLVLRNERISKLLDDWDDGDTDSQQSFSKTIPQETENSSINKLIDDWDDEEDS